jgi:two-component system chemotaxis response regulator CheB
MSDHSFPLVCLGASAGGVDAYIRLVRDLRPDGGCAFVVVNHLRCSSTSLPEILGRATSMRVQLISNGMAVERNHVYVIPPNCELTLRDNAFHLGTITKPFGWPRVITVFLKSTAETWTGRPVAVILSGVGSDGADALRSIKAAGGVTFVQKRETAQHPDMPQNAIDTGFVDFELSPEEIAHELVRIGSEGRVG